ncbi:hypothetical protein [Aquimarina aggregata]|uniref:hypothetical protein n=1 Tax=Aquimarina aggregata TaxID=1642818 RepID=UPI002490ADD6|nr:hypothetical protein [Aquimarina aggregata]
MKFFLITVLLACISSSYAQINIGKSKSPINLYVSKHKQRVFDKVKGTETVFLIPKELNEVNSEKFKDIVQNVWTFNNPIFITEKQYEESKESYITTNNSIVSLVNNGFLLQKILGDRSIKYVEAGEHATYVVYKFMMTSDFKKIRKDKKDRLRYDFTNIGEIFFTPSIKYRKRISGKITIEKETRSTRGNEEPDFYNFDFGYIKNYFQELNRRLSNSENLVIEDGIKKEDKIKELKEKTLYAPKWILKKYNALAATWGKTRTAEDIFGKYNHKYEIIDNEELSNKIINGEDFYYLMHTQFNQKKIISIIHSLTGEIIYLKEEGSYNLTDSDIKGFAKIIK